MYRHDLAKGSNHLIICTPAIFLELLLSQSPFKECDKKNSSGDFFFEKKGTPFPGKNLMFFFCNAFLPTFRHVQRIV